MQEDPTQQNLQPALPNYPNNPVQPDAHKPLKKPNPPIAAQILYAFGFLGLIAGLYISIILYVGSPNTSLLGSLFIPAISVKMVAVVLAVIVIFGFYLVNQIHNGKKWALITYSVLMVLGLLSVLRSYNTRTFVEELIPVFLIVILWTKNRDFFH